jgi:hypothetical protein
MLDPFRFIHPAMSAATLFLPSSFFLLLSKPRPAKGVNLDINFGPIFEREGPGILIK